MDEFQLCLMVEPDRGFEDYLLAVEEVNVGVDIMIVDAEGVVIGGMHQQLNNNQNTQEQHQHQPEVTEDVFNAPYAEVHIQQYDTEINIGNGGVRAGTGDPLLVQPLRTCRPPYNGGFLVSDVPLMVQPLRSIKPDDYKGKKVMDYGDEAGPSGCKEEI